MLLQQATGKTSVEEAIDWIANGYSLDEGVDQHDLLVELVNLSAPRASAAYDKALQRLTREIAQSGFDSSSMLLEIEGVPKPMQFRQALDAVVRLCPSRGLDTINDSAVIAAQRAEPLTMEALCATAGLSYSELRERGTGLPSDPRSSWSPSKVREAFRILDDVVNRRVSSQLAGAIPTGPIEMIPQLYASKPSGWVLVEKERTEGVPYELLLAQRFVGGTWLAHRNHTSTKLNYAIAATVEEMLSDAGFVVLRSSRNGGETPPSHMEEITGTDSRIGVAVLTRRRASYAIVFATARDQGSANKSGANLLKMARPPALPVALVLTGPGWASRNETADLARSFQGRLFTELTLERLVSDVRRTTNKAGGISECHE